MTAVGESIEVNPHLNIDYRCLKTLLQKFSTLIFPFLLVDYGGCTFGD